MIQDLYHDTILHHNSHPKNFRKIEGKETRGVNSLCGDDYSLHNSINDIGFTGHGCAISKASFSIMTTLVKGKTVREAFELKDRAIKFLTGEKVEVPSELLVFSDVHNYPARVKCATLAWRTLEEALNV